MLSNTSWTLHHGDCREVLAQLPDGSVDAVVTDPPYELGFMGKAWDASGVAYDVALWAEVLRVLKPGGHLLAFGGTRTYHRLACAIEDAGFEIRDSIHWLYGSGFPKSLNLTGEWQGWGTALKPAHEPIVVARKPLDGTVAATVLAHGTGALNIDGCRVGMGAEYDPTKVQRQQRADGVVQFGAAGLIGTEIPTYNAQGRWPANVVLDGEAAAELDRQSGDDETGVSRFFFRADLGDDDLTSFRYVAKPDRAERDAGLGDLAQGPVGHVYNQRPSGGLNQHLHGKDSSPAANFHPTVKPLDLMRWLVRLVTPPGGVVLDPFAGSGTTLAAAVLEDRRAVGVELTEDYLPIIAGRVAWAEREARFGAVQGPTQVRKDADALSLFDHAE